MNGVYNNNKQQSMSMSMRMNVDGWMYVNVGQPAGTSLPTVGIWREVGCYYEN